MTTRKHPADADTDDLIRFLYTDRRHSDREIAEALADGWTRVEVTRRRLAMGITRADRRHALASLEEAVS